MHLVKGILAIISIAINTFVVWVPLAWWLIQSTWTKGKALSALKVKMDKILWWWTNSNRKMIKKLGITNAHITWHEVDTMSKDNWYMVISNHQSWTDIVLLQSYLYGNIPPLKFFTKEQLIWVPGIGIAMKVLGFPYVKRITKAHIKANPELRNADRDNTLAACDGFKNHPTSILNFVEGTRRTAAKHSRQSSEYKHLLRPKIGGLDYVLDGMDTHLHKLLDVTIIYPQGVPTFWEFLQGRCRDVNIIVTPYDIPNDRLNSDLSKRRTVLAQWIKEIWTKKDQLIESHLPENSDPKSGADDQAQGDVPKSA